MGEFVVILASFVLGMMTTVTLLGIWTYLLYKKQLKEKTKALEEFTKANDVLEKTKAEYISVKERLAKVRELTKVQMTLSSQVEIPQKNSLDGKYKNGLSKEIKKIEEEKAVILKSILSDGYDPDVSILGENGAETMKLSQFLGTMNTSSKESSTEVQAKKESKLSVLRGGKLSEEEMDKILNDDDGKDKKDN
jgi:hypothetical protein